MGYRHECLVELAPKPAWKNAKQYQDKELLCSGSGILLSDGSVITHGSLLLSFISKNGDENKLSNTDCFSEEYFHGLIALVTLEPKPKQRSSSLCRINNHTAMFKAAGSMHTAGLEQFVGSIKCMWKAKGLSEVIQKHLPSSEGWSFFDDPDKSTQTLETVLIRNLLPFFILIHLCPHLRPEGELQIYKDCLIPGNTVHMIGTPFGSMSPDVFMNSVSEGVISNVVGNHQELIITDARCIPGTEGGPLYLGNARNSKYLLGVIVSALCWKNNEWIGLSLVCNVNEVLQSLRDNIHPEMDDTAGLLKTRTSLHKGVSPGIRTVQPSTLPVALVKCPGSWGTGFIIDQNKGLLLTCGHVVNGLNSVQVRVDHPKSLWYDGDVIFATPKGRAFDLAVIQLNGYTPNKKWPNQVEVVRYAEKGQRCFVIGHALFGQHHNQLASITSGVICKVITLSGVQVLIQSTCTVNAGASGGPLVSEDGQVFGVVSCNAKDIESGASYPSVNLVIPLATVWPVLKHYINRKDISSLNTLHVRNKKIEKLWTMQGSRSSMNPVKSRL